MGTMAVDDHILRTQDGPNPSNDREEPVNERVSGKYGSIGPGDDSSEEPYVVKPSGLDRTCSFCCPCAPEWMREEFPELFNLSWSMIVLSLFSFLFGPVSLAFCGHLGTDQLAGVAMASTVINVTGVSVGVGLATACDTLFSQSYGSVNKKMVGVYLMRSLMIILLFVFPCWAIHLNAEFLLILMGQDRVVARIAGDYILWFMPGLPAVFFQCIMLQYLRCQNIVAPTVVIGGVGVAICALTHYLFLYVFDFGYIGSAISQMISYYLMCILLILYTLISKSYKETWGGWTVDFFYDWWIFLKLAVAGLLMVGLEWWSFEIGTILAGLLGPVPLAAQSVGFQVASLAYMLPLGVGLACNIRVGQMLGAGNALRAKQVTILGIIMIICSGLAMSSLLAATSSVLPRIFSSDEEVITYSKNVVLMVALFEFFDSLAGVCAGVLRGCGRQGLGAGVILVGYYMVGLPVGIALLFATKLEVVGLYIGLTIGLVIESLIFFIIVFRTNWQGEVDEAQVRAGTTDMTEDAKRPVGDDVFTSDGGEVTETTDDDERKPLMNTGTSRRKRKRRFSQIHSPYVPSREVDFVSPGVIKYSRPSKKELFLTRFMFILGMVLIFAAGLCVRLFIPIPEATSTNWTQLCLTMNASNPPNSSIVLPYCNYTYFIVNTTAVGDMSLP